MTTKNISLLAMTSSVAHTWAGLICIGKYCSTPRIQTEAIYQGSTAFLQNAAYTIRFRRFLSNLAECWIWLVGGSSSFMPIFVYTWNAPLPSPVFAWTKSNQYFRTLGRWHFGDILRVPSPFPPRLYCVLLSVYTLGSKTGVQLSQFRTGRHFVPRRLHGCEFPEPGSRRGKHWLSPCWETLADSSQISET